MNDSNVGVTVRELALLMVKVSLVPDCTLTFELILDCLRDEIDSMEERRKFWTWPSECERLILKISSYSLMNYRYCGWGFTYFSF